MPSPRRRRSLPMTLEAVKGYASDVLVGAARGDQEMVSLVGYLTAMVDDPVLDSIAEELTWPSTPS